MALSTRVVVVDGCRTPFLRSGTGYTDLMAYELGSAAVARVLHRTRIDPGAVDMVVMGAVLADPRTTNVAREVVLASGLPDSCPAHSVTVACVSSLQAILDGVRAIVAGDAEAVIAGGVETFSDAPIRFRRPVRKRLIAAQKSRGPLRTARLFTDLKLSDFLPEAPAITEFSTGESMGQTCERLAKRLGITRENQDAFAFASHLRASRATADGLLARQIAPMHVPPGFDRITTDNGIRSDTSIERLGRLSPAFDRRFGTITAGNSSFLTDGGAAVLLMSELKAERLGVEPLAVLRGSSVTAMDPREELLLGPAFAAPRALDIAGRKLDEIAVVELHEAFAAQVLAVLKVIEDATFCRQRLGRSGPLGKIDLARLNAWGGSLSVGHPFGATGARLVINCCHRMRHEKAQTGLVAACAGGAIGMALVLERP